MDKRYYVDMAISEGSEGKRWKGRAVYDGEKVFRNR